MLRRTPVFWRIFRAASRRLDELGTLRQLIGKYMRADLSPGLDSHVDSLYATTEGEIRRVVEPPIDDRG